ncbi:twin-arginine translocation signal domain-containing protein, partial [Mycobacterium sp. E2462]
MNRRQFLGSLAASVVAGVGAARLIVDPQPRTFAQTPALDVPTSGPVAPMALLPPPPADTRIPLPGGGALMKIPGDGDLLALTVDDGVNSEVVRAYTQ